MLVGDQCPVCSAIPRRAMTMRPAPLIPLVGRAGSWCVSMAADNALNGDSLLKEKLGLRPGPCVAVVAGPDLFEYRCARAAAAHTRSPIYRRADPLRSGWRLRARSTASARLRQVPREIVDVGLLRASGHGGVSSWVLGGALRRARPGGVRHGVAPVDRRCRRMIPRWVAFHQTGDHRCARSDAEFCEDAAQMRSDSPATYV